MQERILKTDIMEIHRKGGGEMKTKTQLEKMDTALLDDGTWINLYFYQ